MARLERLCVAVLAWFAHLDRGVRMGWTKIELEIPAAVLVLESGADTGPDALLQAFALDDREELATWCVPKPSPSGTPKRHFPTRAISSSYEIANSVRAEAFWDTPYVLIASPELNARDTVVFETPTSVAISRSDEPLCRRRQIRSHWSASTLRGRPITCPRR